ncbi:hypothetical protein BaRGS_00039039 [Batillaria attramentaria]|uniref:Nanos-type domain-containing protein n=1 Tax=Batillaria attramentaria TaxID=370345 RepID=A0ABD0J458_9CAEN
MSNDDTQYFEAFRPIWQEDIPVRPLDRPSGVRSRTRRPKKLCKFCKNNKEDKKVYEGHNLNDEHGRVVCPKLRQFTCLLCSATGDYAHTIKYCPMSDKVDHALIMEARREIQRMNHMKRRRGKSI